MSFIFSGNLKITESFAPTNEGRENCTRHLGNRTIVHAPSTRLEEIKPTWYTIAAYKLI